MHPRASLLIETLNLMPHPEGGFFREVYCSPSVVTLKSSGAQRTALTSIYYLLADGQVSRWHCLRSDEIWHFLEGEPLELHTLDPSLAALRTDLLGPVSEKAQPTHTVPANFWQAAIPTGAFTLVGCTVGPGFAYEDFSLLADDAIRMETVNRRFPGLARLL